MRIFWTSDPLEGHQKYWSTLRLNLELSRRSHFVLTKDFTGLLSEFPEMGTLEVKEKNLRGFQLTRQREYFIGSRVIALLS